MTQVNDAKTIQQHCSNILKAMHKANKLPFMNMLNYKEIAPDLTDEVMLYLAHHPEEQLSLSKISSQLGRYYELFWQRLCDMRHEISRRELMHIYLTVAKNHWNFMEKAVLLQKKNQWNNKNLIYNEEFCSFLSDKKELDLAPGLMKAIKEDTIPAFELHRTMNGQNINNSLLAILCKHSAGRILGYLINEKLIPRKIKTTGELFLSIFAGLYPQNTVRILQGMEEAYPGSVSNYTDQYGRNLLWYTLTGKYYIWNSNECMVVNYLLDIGCSPDNENIFGQSWRYFKLNAPVNESSKMGTPQRQVVKLYVLKKEHKISSWQNCHTSGKLLTWSMIKNLTRGADGKLLPSVQKQLSNKLKETFWNSEFMPESTLPPSWQTNLTFEPAAQTAWDFQQKKLAAEAMQSYQHPEYGNEITVQKSILQAVPLKEISIDEKPFQDNAVKVLATGWMLYHPLVQEYCRQHVFLTRSEGLTDMEHDQEVAEKVKSLIAQNNVSDILAQYRQYDSFDRKCAASAVFCSGRQKIIAALLGTGKNFTRDEMKKWVFFAAEHLDNDQATALLSALEYRWPGIVRASYDQYDSNALFYTLFNKKINWYDPECPLTEYLKQCDCQADHINRFGIAMRDIADILTAEDKLLRTAWLDSVYRKIG